MSAFVMSVDIVLPFTTGTRDLLLSNTVRVHRKLRQAGVEGERRTDFQC
jgi:hypothetical protein